MVMMLHLVRHRYANGKHCETYEQAAEVS